jgi:hypothetical protein
VPVSSPCKPPAPQLPKVLLGHSSPRQRISPSMQSTTPSQETAPEQVPAEHRCYSPCHPKGLMRHSLPREMRPIRTGQRWTSAPLFPASRRAPKTIASRINVLLSLPSQGVTAPLSPRDAPNQNAQRWISAPLSPASRRAPKTTASRINVLLSLSSQGGTAPLSSPRDAPNHTRPKVDYCAPLPCLKTRPQNNRQPAG